MNAQRRQACKPRANCLKSKEIGKACRNGRRFDLRVVPNYLKVKTIGQHPSRGCWSPGRYDCIMILDSETKAVELPEDHGDEIQVVAASSDLHDPDRGSGAQPLARTVRRHTAALRPDGATRPGARRP